MAGVKVGRNDPCPCGSGKKYKKCCATLGDIDGIFSDPFTHYSQLLAAVKLRLDQHYSSRIRKLRRDLQERFQRFATQAVLSQEHESLFSEWLWFNVQIGESESLGKAYWEDHREFMEPPLRNCLSALNESYLSIYEVLRSHDNFLEVQDIFLKEPALVMIKEPWNVNMGTDHPLLLGRLVNLEENRLFSGMVLIIQEQQSAMNFLQEHLDFLSDVYGQSKSDFLQTHPETIYGLFDHALKGIPVVFNHMESAGIDLRQKADLEKHLIRDGVGQWLHHTGGYDWFQISEDTQDYVRLALGGEDLVWEAQVLKDIRFLRNMLSSLLPGINPMVISNRFLDGPAPEDAFPLWLLMVKDRDTEQWLNTPNEDWAGQTPAQLLTQDGGRPRVQEMLKAFLGSDSNPQSQALIEYMQERISQ